MTGAAGLRCSLNLFFAFPGRPLEEALDGAVAAGFHVVELLDPWSADPGALAGSLARRGVNVDLVNLPAGDLAAGERGFAGDPRRRAEFRAGVEQACRLADRLRFRRANVLAGTSVDGESSEGQLACLVDQLGWASDRLAEHGVQANVELLNPVETPGFLLSSIPRVREVLGALGGRVGFQLDVYHLQRTQGELINTILAMAPITRHVQLADAPGRTEPGSGEINFANVLAAVVESGYRDLVGLEYRPSGRTADPYAWMAVHGLERA